MEKKSIKPLSDEFEFVAESTVDERKRVSLAKVLAQHEQVLAGMDSVLHFQVYVNKAGQILLDPSVSVPLHEVWLYKNPVALAKVQEGLAELEKGALHDLGSFAKYVDDDIE